MSTHQTLWAEVLRDMPLVAILRGLRVEEAIDVGEVLYRAGFRCIEVPLNSPQPLSSIAKLQTHFADKVLIGAGTVLTETEVRDVRGAGASVVVSPNTNVHVIAATKQHDMISIPGFATPSEAFAAIAAGADALKLFPAESASPPVLKSLRAVLPAATPILPVGGIGVDNMRAYRAAGASGFGIGGSLYRPGMDIEEIHRRAVELVECWRG